MIYLTDPVLGDLDLTSANGVNVVDFQVSWPTVREVINPRALTDGVVDTTEYLGARTVTVTIRYDQRVNPTQTLIDLVTPYMSPRRRPTIVWTVQNPTDVCPAYLIRPTDFRSLVVRGADAPLVIEGPRYQTVVLQWVAQDSYVRGLEETCAVARVTGGEEDGRVYDLTFDRDYPFSPPYGTTFFNVAGNAPTDWVGTLTSEIMGPVITINGIDLAFNGMTWLLPGQTVIINTQDRTILRNGDPTDSLYGETNFTAWTWDDIRLQPGQNSLALAGTVLSDDPAITLCWYDNWFS